MQKITDKETPEIILIRGVDLTPSDLFKLNHVYKTDMGEFSILARDADVILINSDMKQAEEVREIVAGYMKRETSFRKREKMFERIGEIAGKKGQVALTDVYINWREARELADRKEEAEQVVKTLRKERILQKAKKERDILEMLHNLGLGVYDKDSPRDWQKANAYCFAYGYWKALQNMG